MFTNWTQFIVLKSNIPRGERDKIMKKQVVKSMSVGLSAITLASSMSVTAFAEELPEAPATTEAEVAESVEATKVEAPMNAEASKAIGEAVEAVEKVKTVAGEETVGKVNGALSNIAKDVKELDDLNRTATDAVEKYEEATNKETQDALKLLEQNAAEQQAAAGAEAAKGGNVSVADAQHQVSVAADAVTATEAAKNQAELDVKKAEEALNAANDAVKAAEAKLAEIEAAYITTNKYGMTLYNGDLKAAYDAATAAVSKTWSERNAAEEKLSIEKNNLEDAETALSNANRILELADAALQTAQSEVDKKQGEFDVAKEEASKAKKAQEEANEAKNKAVDAWDKAKKEKEKLEDSIKGVQKEIDAKDKDIAAKNKQIDAEKKAIEKAEADKVEAGKKLEAAKAKYGEKSAKYQAIVAEIEKYAKQVSELESSIKTLEEQIKQAEADKKQAIEDKTAKENAIKDLEDELPGLQQAASDAAAKEANLKTLSELAKAVSAAQKVLDDDATAKKLKKYDDINKNIARNEENRGKRKDNPIGQQKALKDNTNIAKELIKYYFLTKGIENVHVSDLNTDWDPDKNYLTGTFKNDEGRDTPWYFNYATFNKGNERIGKTYKATDYIILFRKDNSDSTTTVNEATDKIDLRQFKNDVAKLLEGYDETKILSKKDRRIAESNKTKAENEYNNFIAEHPEFADIADAVAAYIKAQEATRKANEALEGKSSDITTAKEALKKLDYDNKIKGYEDDIAAKGDQKSADKKAYDEAKKNFEAKSDEKSKNFDEKLESAQNSYKKSVEKNNKKIENARETIEGIQEDIKIVEARKAKKVEDKKALEAKLPAADEKIADKKAKENELREKLEEAQAVLDAAKDAKDAANSALQDAKKVRNDKDANKKKAENDVKDATKALETARTNKQNAQTSFDNATADHKALSAAYVKVKNAIAEVENLQTQAGVANTVLEAMKDNLEAIVASYDASVKALATTQANLVEAQRLDQIRAEEQARRDLEYYREVARARAAMAKATETASLENVVIADAAVPTAAPARVRRAAAVAATATIEDEQTPLAGDTTETVEAEDSKDEVATIADEKAPLAATAPKSLFAKTWWAWLLLAIALIGGAVAYSKKRVEDKLNK